MNCAEALKWVPAYADGEIDRLRGYLVKRHLAGCADCAAEHDRILALRAQLRAEVPYYGAPPALRARVRETLGVSAGSTKPRPAGARDRWSWLAGGALAGCAATILAWTLGTAVLDWQKNEDIGNEAVALHVRATLANHPIEVASSDQHTVKPWLSARLDYSPPVPDFAKDGFTLLGARLDYLDRTAVATLVYRYRQHTIDVFVRPETKRPAPPALRNVRGFNVAHASGAGMDWLAVSDVSPDVLSEFVQRLARGGASGTDKPQ